MYVNREYPSVDYCFLQLFSIFIFQFIFAPVCFEVVGGFSFSVGFWESFSSSNFFISSKSNGQ